MYKRALQGIEEALGPMHILTVTIVNNLGNLCVRQGKLAEAEEIYKRILRGREETLGPKHTSTVTIVNFLRLLNASRCGHMEAQEINPRTLDRDNEIQNAD